MNIQVAVHLQLLVVQQQFSFFPNCGIYKKWVASKSSYAHYVLANLLGNSYSSHAESK